MGGRGGLMRKVGIILYKYSIIIHLHGYIHSLLLCLIEMPMKTEVFVGGTSVVYYWPEYNGTLLTIGDALQVKELRCQVSSGHPNYTTRSRIESLLGKPGRCGILLLVGKQGSY